MALVPGFATRTSRFRFCPQNRTSAANERVAEMTLNGPRRSISVAPPRHYLKANGVVNRRNIGTAEQFNPQ
jgi:hypothetical protein